MMEDPAVQAGLITVAILAITILGIATTSMVAWIAATGRLPSPLGNHRFLLAELRLRLRGRRAFLEEGALDKISDEMALLSLGWALETHPEADRFVRIQFGVGEDTFGGPCVARISCDAVRFNGPDAHRQVPEPILHRLKTRLGPLDHLRVKPLYRRPDRLPIWQSEVIDTKLSELSAHRKLKAQAAWRDAVAAFNEVEA